MKNHLEKLLLDSQKSQADLAVSERPAQSGSDRLACTGMVP